MVVALVAAAAIFAANASGYDYVRRQAPALLTYGELKELCEIDPPRRELQRKVDRLLVTPFLDNGAWFAGVRPHRPNLPRLGPSMRVAQWNIERGLNLDLLKAMFTGTEAFLEGSAARNVEALGVLRDSIGYLAAADVLVLNEVDWGMKRTGYRAVVRELAEALGMNWTFGVEFLEVDPVNLGTEPFQDSELAESRKLQEMLRVDPGRFRGLHGTAILSRYPIRSATLTPFPTRGYDWYGAEKRRSSKIERGRRKVAEQVFLETILREIRRGGRTVLTATLDVPDLPEKQVTVVATHLEGRARPELRRRQMEELLELVRDFRHPVIVAGDLNTSGLDARPVTLKREIYKRVGSASFWADAGLRWATGLGLTWDVVTGGVNKVKNLNDPTARHVPVLAANPEAAFFETIERFRFADEGAFDFRGSELRSGVRSGTLANSNERGPKGFAATYEVARKVAALGQFKLDWILVKPYGGGPPGASYRFSPHDPRTLRELNYSVPGRLSDHNPLAVDLPLSEPPLGHAP
jgi:endonuclease/exonuclease/phosphatase family metal-dependent hydrolase